MTALEQRARNQRSSRCFRELWSDQIADSALVVDATTEPNALAFWYVVRARLLLVDGRARFEPGSVEHEARGRIARGIITTLWAGEFTLAIAVALIVGIMTGSAGWAIVSAALTGVAFVLIGGAIFLILRSGRSWVQERRHPGAR